MSEYWSVFVWIAGIVFTLANAGLMNRLRMGIREATMDKDLTALTSSIKSIEQKMKEIDEAIRGNGKIGLIERVSVACSEIKDIMRRVDSLEHGDNGKA